MKTLLEYLPLALASIAWAAALYLPAPKTRLPRLRARHK